MLGCLGGLPAVALDYVVEFGITTEEAYPYKQFAWKCKTKEGEYKIKNHA
jgi:hypothetical protein